MRTPSLRRYHDEQAAREHFERSRWPRGPVCPHCGVLGKAYELAGKTTREGLYKCGSCRQPFTVTVGTIFQDSHIPLHKWLLAIHLICSSKNGISAHQLWRDLWGVDPQTGKQKGSYRTAWFMARRLRWMLAQDPLASEIAGLGEADASYVGGKQSPAKYGYEWSASGRPKPKPRKSNADSLKMPVDSTLKAP